MRKFNLFDAMVLVAANAAALALLRMFLVEGRFFQGAPFQGRFESWVLSGIEAAYPFLMTSTFALVILRLRQPRPRIRRLFRQPGMAACSAAAMMLVVQLLGIVPFEIVWSVRNMIAQASTPPVNLPQINAGIGFNSPAAKTNAQYGAPTQAARSPDSGTTSPDSGGAAPSPPPQGQPPGIFPSIPGMNMPTQPVDYWPAWYIIFHIHVHMIHRGYVAAAVAGAWFVLALAGWWRPEPSWIDRAGRVVGFLWIVPYLVYHSGISRLF
jgi:hypothetical protein